MSLPFPIPGGFGPKVVLKNGGNGNDKISVSGNTILHSDGGAGNDTLIGASWSDHLIGGDGNDRLEAKGGKNSVDTLGGGNGDDTLIGGSGDDILSDGDGNDVVKGAGGNDVITGGSGNDLYEGGAGNDIYQLFGNGDDTIIDASGNDQYHIQFSLDAVDFLGFDSNGNGNFDALLIDGGFATHLIKNFFNDKGTHQALSGKGSGAIETFKYGFVQFGFEGIKDLVENWTSEDVAVSKSFAKKASKFTGSIIKDNISGSTKNDTLNGVAGNDTILGNAGNDKIDGGDGDDSLNGGAGNDTLTGGNGNDSLEGGLGKDQLLGALGDDTYIMNGADKDTIKDAGGTDTLNFDEFSFADFILGVDLVALNTDTGKSKAAKAKDFDALSVKIDGVEVFRILNFFDNTSKDLSDLDAGSGAIENWVFSDGTYSFEDITDLLAPELF